MRSFPVELHEDGHIVLPQTIHMALAAGERAELVFKGTQLHIEIHGNGKPYANLRIH